jgi:hypothetical protein
MFTVLHTLQRTGQMLEMAGMLFRFGQGSSSSSTGATGSKDHSSSSSSSSDDGESGSALSGESEQQQKPGLVTQQRSFEGLLPAREILLLLLEVILLQPAVTTTMLCQPPMQNLWSRIQPGSVEAQETAATMLQPVLHLLGPAVLQQLEASSRRAGSGSSSRVVDDADKFASWFGKLAESLVAAGETSCGKRTLE